MSYPVCGWMEKKYRDAPLETLRQQFSQDVQFPLFVHLLQAFGYREEWAEALLSYVHFDDQKRPFFPKSPQTPEAHRHKFLCALTLSEGSPSEWCVDGKTIRSADFVEPILGSPLSNWGDDSAFPEPSWTFQFLSAHLDSQGGWKGKLTPLPGVTQACLIQYYKDFDSGDLYVKGKTIYTEAGLHLLEAVNKLCKAQGPMIVEPATNSPLSKFFPMFKKHLLNRLKRSMGEVDVLLGTPNWQEGELKEKALRIAISNLLVSGHLLETCFHPRGALRESWSEEEEKDLKKWAESLSRLMELFFDPKTLALMNEEQKKAYHFPLFHAYRALVSSQFSQ